MNCFIHVYVLIIFSLKLISIYVPCFEITFTCLVILHNYQTYIMLFFVLLVSSLKYITKVVVYFKHIILSFLLYYIFIVLKKDWKIVFSKPNHSYLLIFILTESEALLVI